MHTRRQATGPVRRRAFWAWSAVTVLVALYMAVAAPLAEAFHAEMWLVAVVVPPLMVVMMGIGFWWLWYLATARRGQRPPGQDEA